jgi:DNA polymerase III epsilon subunit-like protein
MGESQKEQIFCSLDLELTGFDPTIDEILEVGFVFFSVSDNGIAVHDQWSQIFRPSKTVRSKILALTGMNPQEIESAPLFSEYHDFIQEKLENAILVGHSIGVDIRFLEASGIRVRPEFVDTLDLVQFLLPTHHSYNLENLMHYFGIPHPEAHRALADARATVAVLEKLIKIFARLPQDIGQELLGHIRRGDFPWQDLFARVQGERIEQVDGHIGRGIEQDAPQSVLLEGCSLVMLPLIHNLEAAIITNALARGEKERLSCSRIAVRCLNSLNRAQLPRYSLRPKCLTRKSLRILLKDTH